MAHFALMWKARTIEKYRQNYENEKHNSIIMSNANIPDKTLLQRWRHYSHHVQKRLSRTFSKWYPEGTTMSNFLVNFRTEMKFPHILLRSLFGFVGGLILTYLCFMFLIFQLSLSLVNAVVLSSLFGVLITLGLTFSNRTRCLVFLLIPQLFSRAGRYTLTCYALVLILTGPATNTLKNSEVLSESMACSQEQIKTSVREINESQNKPYNSIKIAITLMVEELKRITKRLRSAVLKINRLMLSVASMIQFNFSWLGSVAQTCNDQLGTPYYRCITALKTSVDTCKECVDRAPWYYAIGSVAKIACGVLKTYKKFCVASDYAGETFYTTVRRKVKIFTTRVSKVLYLKIHTRHSYTFFGNTSSPSQVAAGIATEIRNRADPIFTWLSWSSCVTSLFLLLIIFRAKYYQHMFETRSRFDNRYITKEFRQLDLKRMREGRETVLPLSRRERAKYVTTTSFRLVTSEKIYLNRSAVFMTITSFKLMIHMVADYSLYWVLMTIRHHGALQSPLHPGLPTTGARITGKGFVARLLQSLIDTLNIPLVSTPSSNACLPNPHPPDFKGYSQIGILIFFLWFFGLFEPYGLRLRHLIMGHYKPDRGRTRAAWLYNHILRTRGSFMKLARRKLHREHKYRSENKLTFRHWLRSFVPCQWLRRLLGIQLLEDSHCLLCNTVENTNDVNTELIRCQVPNCPGTYCTSCFSDIGQMCTICLTPTDYGDLSDVSLEKGSSDDDNDNDDKTDGSKPNHDNAVNQCTDSDDSSKSEGNNRISDKKTEYSGNSKDVDYGMSTLLRCHNKTAYFYENRFTNDAKGVIDKTVTKFNRNCFHMPLKVNYFVTQFDIYNFKLAKQIYTGLKNTVVSNNNESNIFYSFYRIYVNDMSFTVTKYGKRSKLTNRLKKLITRNKKTTNKRHLLFVTCNNDQEKRTHKVPKGDKTKEEVAEKKIEDHTQQSSINKTDKNIKKGSAKKPKKNQRENRNRINVSNNKSSSGIESIHAKISKYWKNISNALSCTYVTDTKKDAPATEEKQHKRKKKNKKIKDNNSKKHQNSKNTNEDTRQYRISTYLADRDWKINSINCAKSRSSFNLNEVDDNEVNYVMIPRLNLHSSESLNNDEEKSPIIYKKDLQQTVISAKKSFKIGPLNRFIKSRNVLTTIEQSSSNVILENGSAKKQENLDFRMSRSEKYFRSLGNDFQTNDQHSNPNLKSSKTSVQDPIGPSCVVMETINNEKAASDNEKKPNDNVPSKTEIPKPEETNKSLVDLTKRCSNIKRQSSSEMCFGFKSPLLILKNLYTSIFNVSDSDQVDGEDKDEEVKEVVDIDEKIEAVKETADKEVAVFPCMKSSGYQISCQQDDKPRICSKRKNRCIQVEQKDKSHCEWSKHPKTVCNVHVNAVHPTCTCATQYYMFRRDVGTLKTQATYRKREPSETESSENEFSSASESCSSNISDKTQTNTTVCSLTTVDYHNKRKKTDVREHTPRKRIRVKVVTKANQSTLTDKAKVHDVSTVTYDWWSPIVEKKVYNKEIILEKKEGCFFAGKERERRSFKNRGMITDDRIVKFRSGAQIIPSSLKVVDILSPSQYLLESQKYYNELFSSKIYSPNAYPVSCVFKNQKFESRSPVSSRHQSRRGRRTKRLEECYSRKQATPRNKRSTDPASSRLKIPDLNHQVKNANINKKY